MNNLKDILGIDLNTVSILDIDEEILIKLKNNDYYTQSNFYFYLVNKLNELEDSDDKVSLAHINFLISYYVYIIFNPLFFEEISFKHGVKANNLNPCLKYKEWLLMFAMTEKSFLKPYYALTYAEEILEKKPDNEIAKFIISIF
ncbi:hypothetical protein [Clostridium sp. Ade.TY]|uniref:hypothetical protein n=1 Tax=Clostridium sp. Ade.TY TaxID=1391647 RepID=UPI00040A0FBE|nr:hypothetical protein [Clostridium sp. Ade.TY]